MKYIYSISRIGTQECDIRNMLNHNELLFIYFCKKNYSNNVLKKYINILFPFHEGNKLQIWVLYVAYNTVYS